MYCKPALGHSLETHEGRVHGIDKIGQSQYQTLRPAPYPSCGTDLRNIFLTRKDLFVSGRPFFPLFPHPRRPMVERLRRAPIEYPPLPYLSPRLLVSRHVASFYIPRTIRTAKNRRWKSRTSQNPREASLKYRLGPFIRLRTFLRVRLPGAPSRRLGELAERSRDLRRPTIDRRAW